MDLHGEGLIIVCSRYTGWPYCRLSWFEAKASGSTKGPCTRCQGVRCWWNGVEAVPEHEHRHHDSWQPWWAWLRSIWPSSSLKLLQEMCSPTSLWENCFSRTVTVSVSPLTKHFDHLSLRLVLSFSTLVETHKISWAIWLRVGTLPLITYLDWYGTQTLVWCQAWNLLPMATSEGSAKCSPRYFLWIYLF